MTYRLNLDYQRKSTGIVKGIVLLGIALLLSALIFSNYHDVNTAIERDDSMLLKLERLAGHKSVSSGKRDAEPYGAEVKSANDVINQLVLPWDQLFDSVEGATGKNVALLTIQPDKQKGMVVIGGEAKNAAAMLSYMRHLNEAKQLRDIVLMSHQIQQQDPQKPVRFNLSAKWILD